MMDKLAKELEGIGLAEKESRVYLAALELGPSTAQTIAAKATVNRPTTYIAIESLVRKGLMSSITKGKKRFFVAEPPNRIFDMIGDERRELEERESIVTRIMGDLKALSMGGKERPEVLFFEGVRGVERMREGILGLKSPLIKEFMSLDTVRKEFPPSGEGHWRIGRKDVSVRTIYASESGIVLPEISEDGKSECRLIPHERYPFDGDIFICGDMVGILNFTPKLTGIQISHQVIANTFHKLFDLAWDSFGKPAK